MSKAVACAGAVRTTGGIHTVIIRRDLKSAILNGNRLPLYALIAVRNRESARLNHHRTVRVNAVFARSDHKASSGNVHAVFTGKAMTCSRNLITASRDRQLILGSNAVSCRTCQDQTATAVQRQIGLGKNCGIDIVVIDSHKLSSICKMILRSVLQSDKHLIGFQRIDGSGGLTCNRSAVQHNLYFITVISIHDHLSVIKRACKNVGSFIQNRDPASIDRHRIGRTDCRITAKGNRHSRRNIVICICCHLRGFRCCTLFRSAARKQHGCTQHHRKHTILHHSFHFSFSLLKPCCHRFLIGYGDLEIPIPAAQFINKFLFLGRIPQNQIIGQFKKTSHVGGLYLCQRIF